VPAADGETTPAPDVVDVTEHVLNEISVNVNSVDTEAFSVLFADESGLIRYHHPIESESFLKRRRKSIRFKPPIFDHMRRLASLLEGIDHRLAGDCHSHPVSGVPKQSPADKRFSKRVWRNPRNTNFVAGRADNTSGPDVWTVVDDGYEARKEVDGNLLRVRAFAGGTNEPKEIKIHTSMGG
jgi:hypothetical protein